MAVDKLVDSTQLNSALSYTAARIRAKTGGASLLPFDLQNEKGFGDSVDAIPTGTTPTGTMQITITQNGTTTEDVAAYASAEITVDVQGSGDVTKYISLIARSGTAFEDDTIITTGRSAFAHWSTLTTLNLPNLETIGDSCFQGCSSISKFFFPNATTISSGNAFNSAGLPSSAIVLPKLTTYPSMNAINAFSGSAVDLGPSLPNITSYMFNGSTNMATLVLRKDTLAELIHINAFNNTPFASGKSGGTLYVPQALIASYQAATNWSTILGYANNSIQAIEGSAYENAYADGTPIT